MMKRVQGLYLLVQIDQLSWCDIKVYNILEHCIPFPFGNVLDKCAAIVDRVQVHHGLLGKRRQRSIQVVFFEELKDKANDTRKQYPMRSIRPLLLFQENKTQSHLLFSFNFDRHVMYKK